MSGAAQPESSSPPPFAAVSVSLDASNLDTSCGFYRDLLGFQVSSAKRPGLIFEERALRSDRIPGFELNLRAAFGRRPIGSPGGMLALGFRVADLPGMVERLKGSARWVDGVPPSPFTGDRIRLADPDGYLIELRA